jgi:hypothetical protein
MEVPIGIFLIIIIAFYLLWNKNYETSVYGEKFSEIRRHGHRCFIDGLDHAEKEVVRLMSYGLSHTDYFIFNNLIIPSDRSVSTQIDHVIVSRYGIFVIETKEYNGWIYAHKNRAQWTTTYNRGSKFIMESPLWQNYGHVQALKKVMPFIENNFFNIVVFVGNCELKNQRIDEVLYGHEVVEKILSYNKPVISEQRLLMAIGKLSYMCQAIDITPQEHIANIKSAINDKLLVSVKEKRSYN